MITPSEIPEPYIPDKLVALAYFRYLILEITYA